MKLTGWTKTAMGVLAAAVLVGLTVAAVHQEPMQAGEAAVAATATECTHQCATCPLRGTDACPAGSDTEQAQPCATVDASRCVGCGKCVAVAPEAFEIDPETGKAKIKDGASQEDIARGIRACPVGAIKK